FGQERVRGSVRRRVRRVDRARARGADRRAVVTRRRPNGHRHDTGRRLRPVRRTQAVLRSHRVPMTSRSASPPPNSPIAVVQHGAGPEVLLVHGGASPETTWSGLESLSQRWTLTFAYRRGFAPSPEPPGGRQDFDQDATDIAELLDRRRLHLVGHSYGGVVAAIAATRRPAQVRSLTLLEPALF